MVGYVCENGKQGRILSRAIQDERRNRGFGAEGYAARILGLYAYRSKLLRGDDRRTPKIPQ